MSKVSIEEALDDCIGHLFSDGLDACLRRYPQYASELAALLRLSLKISRVVMATPSLSDVARGRMRARLFAARGFSVAPCHNPK